MRSTEWQGINFVIALPEMAKLKITVIKLIIGC
jgi:hypothetical protein